MMPIRERLSATYERVRRAAQSAGRDPADVAVVAVSKTFPAQAVVEAMVCGQRAFGENYAREGIEKMAAVAQLVAAMAATIDSASAGASTSAVIERNLAAPEWHFIGPIQSNKTRSIAERFDWVHGVDRWQIAQRLSEQRPAHLPPLQACIQVNISGETSKSGVAPRELQDLARQVVNLPRLTLRGLMGIPEPTDDIEQQRSRFRALRSMKDNLADAGIVLDTLSMGMSDDLEVAVAEGATLVRIGRAIFGDRPRNDPDRGGR